MSGQNNTIDALSKTLGEIVSDIRHIREKTDVINDKVESINKATIKHSMMIDASHSRLDGIDKKIESAEKRLDGHDTFKTKAKVWIGIAVGVWGFIISFAGTALKPLISGLF